MPQQMTLGSWARTKRELDKKVDLVAFMAQNMSMSRMAAQNLIAHGNVKIDGYTIGMHQTKQWTQRQLEGRMLKAYDREVRMYGSRSVKNLEQMRLADNRN